MPVVSDAVAYPSRDSTTAGSNNHGVISHMDINPFVKALGNLSACRGQHPSCPWRNCEINGDGAVYGLDIDGFVAVLFGG